jgi:flavin reductase (DIM6/NTAB) family NADH-FMN oxidoreductase RutF
VPIDVAGYRKLIGHFATGVTVITTANGGLLHGMTANAITSVSLDPLLLLVCVDREAHAYEQLLQSKRFGVNILAEEQEDVSRLFATKGDPEQGRLRGAEFHLAGGGTPVLEGSLAHIECDVADQFKAGDHTIFIGAVLDGQLLREAPPLLFYQAGYRRLQP